MAAAKTFERNKSTSALMEKEATQVRLPILTEVETNMVKCIKEKTSSSSDMSSYAHGVQGLWMTGVHISRVNCTQRTVASGMAAHDGWSVFAYF